MTLPERRYFRFSFGNVVFDERAGTVHIHGKLVRSQRQQRELLSVLIRRQGEVLSWQDLLDEVWGPDVDFDFSPVRTAINRLRTVLGEDDRDLVQTLPGDGYRFDAEVKQTEVYRESVTKLEIEPNQLVPRNEGYVFRKRLGGSKAIEAWLAERLGTGEAIVFKLAADKDSLRELKREYSLSLAAREVLGARSDLVQVRSLDIAQIPYVLESNYGGTDLAHWAASNEQLRRLDLAQRLRLFVRIAEAVDALHRVPICHCDIKPANVLIRQGGSEPEVCLIDFGSSLHLDQKRLEALAETAVHPPTQRPDDLRRGTLLYMAPERRAGGPGSVAGDLYSLGVLLLQLVTADLALGLDSGWERQVGSPALVASIKQATDSDPANRQASVGQLLNEVRSLDARDKQMAEQQRREKEQARWQARRPYLYGAIGALALGLTVSVVFGTRERSAVNRLAAEQALTTATNHFLVDDILGQANPSVTGRSGVPVEEAVKKAAERIDARFADSPKEVRARLHAAMAKVLSNLGELGLSARQGRLALDLAADRNLTPAEVADIRLTLAHDLIYRGQNDQAKSELDQIDTFLSTAGTDYVDQKIKALWMRAQIDYNLFARDEALKKFRRAWELRTEWAAYVTPALMSEVGTKYAEMTMLSGKIDDAEAIARQHVAWQAEHLGPNDWRTCGTQVTLTRILAENGKAPEADEILPTATACIQKALGPDSKLMVGALRARAEVDKRMGRFEKAAEGYGLVIPRYATTRGPRSLIVYDMRMEQAIAYRVAGNAKACARLTEELLNEWKVQGAPNEPMRQRTTFFLAGCRLDQGITRGVDELLRTLDAKTLFEDDSGCRWEAMLAFERAQLALALGRRQEAKALLASAETVLRGWQPKPGQFIPPIDKAKHRAM